MIKRDDPRFLEYFLRLWKLVEYPRGMSLRAAKIVVGAAMFGDGCTEGTVRAKIQKDIDDYDEKMRRAVRGEL